MATAGPSRGAPRRPASAQIHPDALRLGVEVEAGHSRFAAEAGSLVAAVGGRGVVQVVSVDPHGAGLQYSGGAVRLLDVACPDPGAQAVEGIVRLLPPLVKIVE